MLNDELHLTRELKLQGLRCSCELWHPINNALALLFYLAPHNITSQQKAANEGKLQDDMFPETRDLLEEFYGPFNKLLAQYLGDETFNYTAGYGMGQNLTARTVNLTSFTGQRSKLKTVLYENSTRRSKVDVIPRLGASANTKGIAVANRSEWISACDDSPSRAIYTCVWNPDATFADPTKLSKLPTCRRAFSVTE